MSEEIVYVGKRSFVEGHRKLTLTLELRKRQQTYPNLTVDLTPINPENLSLEVSIQGDMRGRGGEYSGGQNQNDVLEFFSFHEDVRKIVRLWNHWHLNSYRPGTGRQQEALDEWLLDEGNKYDYEKVCAYLKKVGLYVDRGYEYGCAWLYELLPEVVVNELKILFSK